MCGGRYSGRPVQVTQCAPAGAAGATRTTGDGGDENARWARAAPPKFRRLQLTASLAGKRLPLAEEGGEELERRRTETRFLSLENMLSGARAEDMALGRWRRRRDGDGDGDGDGDYRGRRPSRLPGIRCGRPSPQPFSSTMQATTAAVAFAGSSAVPASGEVGATATTTTPVAQNYRWVDPRIR